MKTRNWILFWLLSALLLVASKQLWFISNFGDSSFRFHPSEAPLNTFAFFWTNFWYIPLFFYVLCASRIGPALPLFLMPWVLIVYGYEVYDLSSNNWLSHALPHSQTSLNILLTNSINKYHPFMFYCSVVILTHLHLLSSASVTISAKRWENQVLLYNMGDYILLGFSLVFSSLYLGSWWALQEGTWGGWWNWDASETFGFFLLLAFLRWCHLFNSKALVLRLSFSIRFFLAIFAALYFLMQLNFDLISHNFGIKFFFFFNNSFFLVEMLFLSTLVVFFKALEYFFFSSCFKLLTPFKKRVATTVVFKRLLLVVAIQIFWSWVFMASFAPVLSYFYWSYFELNVFNEVGLNLLTHLTTTLAIVSLYFMLTNAYFTRTLLLISCSSSNFFIVLTAALTWLRLSNRIHLVLPIFLILSLQTPQLQLNYSLIKTPFLLFTSPIPCFWLFQKTLVLDDASYFFGFMAGPLAALDFFSQAFLQASALLPLFGFWLVETTCVATLITSAETLLFTHFIEVSSIGAYAVLAFCGLLWNTRLFFYKSRKFSF